MNVLITGATGFIGAALTKRLLSLGYHCRCLVRDKNKAENLFGLSPNIDYRVGDLNDSDSLRAITKNRDVVYHLAAAGTQVFRRKGYEDRMFQTNVLGTENLLRECLSHPLRKLIHFSSSSVMGPIATEVANEQTVCRPVNPYQRSKLEGEELVLRFWREHRLPAVVLRPCPVYGPGGKGRLYDIVRLIQKGLLPRFGNRKTSVFLVNVRDVIQAALLAENKAQPGEVFIIASEQAYDMELIRKLILENLGLKRPSLYVPAGLAKTVAFFIEKAADVTRTIPILRVKDIDAAIAEGSFSIEKAKNLLGFHPEVDLKSGLRDTLQWYQENGFI